jgi:hypothetical protein
MSEQPFHKASDGRPTGRRPYIPPKLIVFGDMKALTAGGSPPVEEGGDVEPALLGSIP